MFAIGRLKVAAAALAGSWLLVIVADVVLAELAPARLVVAALALGNTIGQTVVAVPLVIATRRICGPAALAGVNHAAGAGQAAGAGERRGGRAVCLAAPVGREADRRPAWPWWRPAARSSRSAWSRTSWTRAT